MICAECKCFLPIEEFFDEHFGFRLVGVCTHPLTANPEDGILIAEDVLKNSSFKHKNFNDTCDKEEVQMDYLLNTYKPGCCGKCDDGDCPDGECPINDESEEDESDGDQ